MNHLQVILRRWVTLMLVVTLLSPSLALAKSKPLTPDLVHERILKRGVGNWVWVQEDSGVVLVGRIVTIDGGSFGLQLHNDPEITPVLYSEVVDLRTGPSRAAMWTIVGVGIAGMVILAVVAHHEMSNMKMPTLPAQPALSPR
jgi:hypothetical protein